MTYKYNNNLTDSTCGLCSTTPSPSTQPLPLPSRVPTPLPSIRPIPAPSMRPTALPSAIPSPLPTVVPTNYYMPNCTNGTLMKLTLHQKNALGWSNIRALVEDSGGTIVLTNRTLEAGRYSDAEWLCFSFDCFKASVKPINQGGSWDISMLIAGSMEVVVSGSEDDVSNFCVDENGIRNNPTLNPTPLPTVFPTTVPTTMPSFVPTSSHPPTLIPTTSPTFIPSYVPTTMPSLLPTTKPSPLPTLRPTLLPSPLPTMSPTQICSEGQYLDTTTHNCKSCPSGRYRNHSMPFEGLTFSDPCDQCSSGYYSKGGAAVCTKCDAGKVSNSNFDDCGMWVRSSSSELFPL